MSVTNEEQSIEWKEHGLIVDVPKDSLPTGCDHTHVTIFIAKPDTSNPAQDSEHSRNMYTWIGVIGLKCIDGEEPKGLTLRTCRSTVDTPQSQGEWLWPYAMYSI